MIGALFHSLHGYPIDTAFTAAGEVRESVGAGGRVNGAEDGIDSGRGALVAEFPLQIAAVGAGILARGDWRE